MGVFFRHDLVMVVSGSESEYVDTIGSHLEGLSQSVPVYDKSYDGNQIRFTSMGYGIFDIKSLPLPDSLVGIVHRITGCQGQDISMIDSITVDDINDWVDYEYSDPYSEYWTECNPQFNLYTSEPSYNDLMEDYDGDDEDEIYETRYQEWFDTCMKEQNDEFDSLITYLENQI